MRSIPTLTYNMISAVSLNLLCSQCGCFTVPCLFLFLLFILDGALMPRVAAFRIGKKFWIIMNLTWNQSANGALRTHFAKSRIMEILQLGKLSTIPKSGFYFIDHIISQWLQRPIQALALPITDGMTLRRRLHWCFHCGWIVIVDDQSFQRVIQEFLDKIMYVASQSWNLYE